VVFERKIVYTLFGVNSGRTARYRLRLRIAAMVCARIGWLTWPKRIL